MKILFVEPNLLHPDSDISIFEVAKKLEKRFKLCEKFINDSKNMISIENRFLTCLSRNYDIARIKFDLENFIMNLWRNYINKELHNIHTKASIKENRKSFIKSGAYYKSMKIVLELQQ